MRNKKQNDSLRFEPPAVALARWNPNIKAAVTEGETVINIYSEIGETYDGTGMTPKIVSSILRKAEGKDVVVNINSAGGSFFDGIAIHTLLKEYEGNVNVRVIGLAASAASIIAMAGNSIEISEHGFMMIHNAWTIAMGNKDDMQDVADMLDQFDESMVKLYAKASGVDEKEVRKMMADETWLDGSAAVEMGFASKILGEEKIVEDAPDNMHNAALRELDVQLAKSGMPRSERRALIKKVSNTPCAVESTTPCASELTEALAGLLNTVQT